MMNIILSLGKRFFNLKKTDVNTQNSESPHDRIDELERLLQTQQQLIVIMLKDIERMRAELETSSKNQKQFRLKEATG